MRVCVTRMKMCEVRSAGAVRRKMGVRQVSVCTGAPCSNRTVFLNLSGCSSLAASDPLLPTWMSLVLSPSCWVFCDVSARCVRMSNRHLLIISVPGFHKHISCTSLNSSSFPLFHSLCLGDSVSVRIHPCFSRRSSLNDRSDSLSAFVIMWLCCFSMRCKRCTSWTASRVRELQCPLGSTSGALSTTILGNGGPASSLSAVTFFVNFNSGATICHGVPHKPSQFVDSQASLSVCPVQLLHRTTPFLEIHKTAPVRS